MDDSDDAAIFPLPAFASAFRVDLELIRDLYSDDWIDESRQQTTCSSVQQVNVQ